MISWMAENKEWLFDGIGVLLLSLAATGFGAWIVRRRRGDKKNQPFEPPGKGGGALLIDATGNARGGDAGDGGGLFGPGGAGGTAVNIRSSGDAIGGKGGRGGVGNSKGGPSGSVHRPRDSWKEPNIWSGPVARGPASASPFSRKKIHICEFRG